MNKKQTTTLVRITLFIGTIISLFFVPWVVVRLWLTPLPATVQQQVDDAVNLGFEGIIVYVDQAGKDPAFYAAGWNNREQKVKANPHLLFKIASIGKLYDAVAITRLVSQKRLSLDNTLAFYFPELDGRIANADKITLRMMVQHRSGIPNYTDTPNFWSNPPQTSKETLNLVLDLPADFQPNKKYAYSNTNYLLISQLIEKITGANKSVFINQEILKPLHLKNTFASIHDIDTESLMSGYYVDIDNDFKTTDYGSMVASAHDVGVFLRALNNGTLFKEGEKELYASIYVFDHTGWIPGYQSIARYHKDIDAVVIQFMNTTGGYNWNTGTLIYKRIIKLLHK